MCFVIARWSCGKNHNGVCGEEDDKCSRCTGIAFSVGCCEGTCGAHGSRAAALGGRRSQATSRGVGEGSARACGSRRTRTTTSGATQIGGRKETPRGNVSGSRIPTQKRRRAEAA
eukprot:PhF_6_TR27882/c0_g2_i1/m.40820